MSSQVVGVASNITAPPSAVSIASSTNATPIVITTATAHGLNTGDQFFVDAHSVNTSANGPWIAGTVTATTVVLTGSVGIGVGGATGTLRSMALGATFPIPDDGDQPDASSVGVPFEAVADKLAFLWGRLGWSNTVYRGGIWIFQLDTVIEMQSGSELWMQGSSVLTIDQDAIFSCELGSDIRFLTGAIVTYADASETEFQNGSLLELFGNVGYKVPQRPADAGTITVDATVSDTHILAAPGGVRTVTVKSTSLSQGPLLTGQRIRIMAPGNLADGLWFNVKREDASTIAALYGYTVTVTAGDVQGRTWVELYWTGSVWRGLTASGYVIDGASW